MLFCLCVGLISNSALILFIVFHIFNKISKQKLKMLIWNRKGSISLLKKRKEKKNQNSKILKVGNSENSSPTDNPDYIVWSLLWLTSSRQQGRVCKKQVHTEQGEKDSSFPSSLVFVLSSFRLRALMVTYVLSVSFCKKQPQLWWMSSSPRQPGVQENCC